MLLAIDTCGDPGTVALARLTMDGVELGVQTELAGKTYSALLVPAIWQLLERMQVTLAEVRALVVVHGPGSFTGVRVGMSAAKGLAEAAGKPLIAISRLELLARKREAPVVCAALDAGRGEFYAGVYRSSAKERERLVNLEELDSLLAESHARLVICEERVEERLGTRSWERVPPPTAMDAAAVGAERLAAGTFDDIALLDANYLRRSDAEIFARKPAALPTP